MKFQNLFLVLLAFAFYACGPDLEKKQSQMEVLPYFDLSGLIDKEVSELPDSVLVSKGTRVNGDQKFADVVLSREDIAKELEIFKEADINKPTFALSYETQVKGRYLIHELKDGEKGKLKTMTVTYGNDEVTGLTIKMKEENIFYSSTTIASLYLSARGFNLDHYSIETTQKIRWMDPNNMKISGVLRMD